MDPFLPTNAENIKKLTNMQQQIHENFIQQVKIRRSGKIIDDEVFTGNVYLGQRGVDMGLVGKCLL